MAKRLPGVLHSPGRPGSEGEAPEILMRWWRDLARPGRTWTVSTRLRLWSWSKGQWSVQQAVAPSRVEMFRAPESHNFLGRQGSKPVEKWNCHELPAGISRPLRRQDRPILCNMHVARRNWFCTYTDIHVKDCESASMLVATEMEFVRTCGGALSFQETMWCFLMSISTAGARLSPILTSQCWWSDMVWWLCGFSRFWLVTSYIPWWLLLESNSICCKMSNLSISVVQSY